MTSLERCYWTVSRCSRVTCRSLLRHTGSKCVCDEHHDWSGADHVEWRVRRHNVSAVLGVGNVQTMCYISYVTYVLVIVGCGLLICVKKSSKKVFLILAVLFVVLLQVPDNVRSWVQQRNVIEQRLRQNKHRRHHLQFIRLYARCPAFQLLVCVEGGGGGTLVLA